MVTGLLRAYANWLHTRWPSGTVEKLPRVGPGGSTNVPGVFVVGDLTGIPLLKFSADSGARVIDTITANPAFQRQRNAALADTNDVIIIGGGVSGMSAALAARQAGLEFTVLESAEPFSTIVNFPRAKPIYTYPTDMVPAGDMQFTATVKEPLLEELRAQTLALGINTTHARAERIVREHGQLIVVLGDGARLATRSVVVAIGRSGNYRKLGVPGEDLDKVYNRLHDPKDFCGQDIAVIGGGDSALETAIALAECGSRVTLSYRKPEFSRPKPDNVERLQRLSSKAHTGPGSIDLLMPSRIESVGPSDITMTAADGRSVEVTNQAVFAMIGREAPLDFFRRSGIRIRGEWSARTWASCILFVLFCVFLYHWKGSVGLPVKQWFESARLFPFNVANPSDAASLTGTLRLSMQDPSFYYSLAYCACVVGFGIKRIRRRRTPYVTVQTWTLATIQCIPLFLLPYVLLPWLGHNGTFGQRFGMQPLSTEQVQGWAAVSADLPDGDISAAARDELRALPDWTFGPDTKIEKSYGNRIVIRDPGGMECTLRLDNARLHFRRDNADTSAIADALFPPSEWSAHGREFWRSVGFILAWPLLPWNVFTGSPLWAWLVIGFLQTCVIIPLLIWKWGKGAYCGWICSCGALAETMGDDHREKMPHGPGWNRLNMIGQVFLAASLLLLVARIIGWIIPGPDLAEGIFSAMFHGKRANGSSIGGVMSYLNYAWFVDLLWAGILGVCFYFWFSGRVWCRFACPLAALMHIYARFSRFRIAADKKKCISCNVCTSVCHQGIDVMNFANKGRHMEDPECVRCSACVQSCPTGVLEFVQINVETGAILHRDRLSASPVRAAEQTPTSFV